MKKLATAPLREGYRVLGIAFKAADVWLARHLVSQQLVLVQRLAHPQPALTGFLHCQLPWLPRVLDHWVGEGSLYAVLERVDGPSLEQLGTGGLCPATRASLRSLLESLKLFGIQLASASSLCLDAQGGLRLRWLPGMFPAPSFQAA